MCQEEKLCGSVFGLSYKFIMIHYLKQILPMMHFTHEELSPSEKTLNLIKQIAYTYRAHRMGSSVQMYCLN